MDEPNTNSQKSNADSDSASSDPNPPLLKVEEEKKLEASRPDKQQRYRNPKTQSRLKRFGSWIKNKAAHTGLHDWLMVAFTLVLTIVGVEQGILAWQNSKTSTIQMNRFLDAAGRIEDAADSFSSSSANINRGIENAVNQLAMQVGGTQKIIDLTTNQFIVDQRPYVLILGTEFALVAGDHARVHVFEANFGKSPAVHHRTVGIVFFGENSLQQADTWFKTFPKNMSANKGGSDQTIPQGGIRDNKPADYTTILSQQILTQLDIDLISTRDSQIVAIGRFFYFDIIGNEHHTDFCYTRLASGATASCPKHNEVH